MTFLPPVSAYDTQQAFPFSKSKIGNFGEDHGTRVALFLCFPQEKIKLRNTFNFSDTAVACNTSSIIYDLYQSLQGFIGARLFAAADTESPFKF